MITPHCRARTTVPRVLLQRRPDLAMRSWAIYLFAQKKDLPCRDSEAIACPRCRHARLVSVMIETKRLILRQYVATDVPAIVALTSDSKIGEFVVNLPESPGDAWSRFLRWAGHWSLFGYGNLAVVDKESGQIIGEVGAGHFHRGIDMLTILPEASWLFCKESHGKGFAFEAMSAFVEWMDRFPAHPGLACLIEPINKPSITLAGKLGFLKEDDVLYRDRLFNIFIRN